MATRFEWDRQKARRNIEKHKVSFEEAVSAFYDGLSITVRDPDPTVQESRFQLVGTSRLNRLIVVSHTDRGDIIRVISARLATRKERRTYENN